MELPPGWRRANLPAKQFRNAATNNGAADLVSAIAFGLGFTVSGRDAIGINTVFACVGLLARTMSMLPLKIYGADNKPLTKHELASVILYPNEEMTGVNFRSAITANAALHGAAYAVITRDAGGRIRELRPVPSGQVTVSRSQKDGRLKYKIYNAVSGSQQEFDFSRILHFRSSITFDGITTLSPDIGLERVIQIARAIDTFNASFYSNGASPSTLVQTKHALTADQIAQLKMQIESNASTPGMARPLILGQDMEAKSLQQNARDSQAHETRKEQDLAICRMFGVPPHKVGIFGDTASASVEQKALEFIQSTIGPLCAEQEAVYGALLPRNEQGTVHFKHNLGALLRGDTAARNASFAIGRQNGWLSVNEIRALEEMEPIEGGDTYLEPLNMKEAGSGSTGNPGTQTTRQSQMQTNRLINNSMKPLITFPGLEPGYNASIRKHYVNLDGGLTRPSQERAARIRAEWKARATEYTASGNENEFPIYNEIGATWDGSGITADSVRSFLATRSGQDITFAINSIGGDVFEGVAIYNLIAQHNGKVTMRVDSLAASIATVILMAGDEIEIANNAMLMVHKSWSIVVGNADDMRKEADIMDSIDAGPLLAAYTARTGRSAEELEPILAAETWLTAQEALDGKFVDKILPAKAAPAPAPPEDPAAKAALSKAFHAALNKTAHLKKQLATVA